MRFVDFLPSWRQRAVSKRWNLRIIAARLRALGSVSVLDELQVSPSYFEGDTDFLARRLLLGPCGEDWSGTAEAVLLRGRVGQELELLGPRSVLRGYDVL